MSKPTVATLAAQNSELAYTLLALEARLHALETQSATPTPDAVGHALYVRNFFAAKAATKATAALRASAPTTESPTFRQLLQQAAAQYDVPMHELTFRGGKVMHRQTELSLG